MVCPKCGYDEGIDATGICPSCSTQVVKAKTEPAVKKKKKK